MTANEATAKMLEQSARVKECMEEQRKQFQAAIEKRIAEARAKLIK